MQSKYYLKLENINSSIDELVKEAFFAGIAIGCNEDFVRFGNYYVSRRNHGAISDADQCFGRESKGDFFSYDSMINQNNKFFSPITKEFAEGYLLKGNWEGFSNSSYCYDGYNKRVVYNNVISFYTCWADNEIKTILKNNDIDPERYKDCFFCGNWLAEEADEENAFAIFIPVQNNFYDSYGYQLLAHKHRAFTPLILKVSKSYYLPIHDCFTYPFNK